MSPDLRELQTAIESLTEEQRHELRRWFLDRDWEEWDRQLHAHAEAGKLDFLVSEALDAKKRGQLRDL